MDLRAAILSLGRVEGDLLRVERFLNHRVEPKVMEQVGHDLAELLAPGHPELILTAEASGIVPALRVAEELSVPMIFAKKYVTTGARTSFVRNIASPTKGSEYRIEVARHLLEPESRVAVVDDFLSRGRTAEALGEIVEEAEGMLTGFGFVIEKTFVGGRARLEARSWTVHSLARIESLAGGEIVLG